MAAAPPPCNPGHPRSGGHDLSVFADAAGMSGQGGIMIGKAGDWAARHRAEMALSLRITAAGLIAFALGEALGVQQVYWAVLTTTIVMQASVGGSLKATLDRLVGTAAGGVWGAITAAIPHRRRRDGPHSGRCPGSAGSAGGVVAGLPGRARHRDHRGAGA